MRIKAIKGLWILCICLTGWVVTACTEQPQQAEERAE